MIKISPLWGFQLLQRLKVPHSYLWSQALIPKPSDWPAQINVTGFSFLKSGSAYSPPDDLVAFLRNGPTPIYIGFGSIVVKEPARLTDLIFEATKLAGVRAIVSKGWGGIGTATVPKNIYMIGNCPHVSTKTRNSPMLQKTATHSCEGLALPTCRLRRSPWRCRYDSSRHSTW